MIEDYRKAVDRITLSDEAEDRILKDLLRADLSRMKGKKQMNKRTLRPFRTAAAVLAALLLAASSAYAVTTRISMNENRIGDSIEIVYGSLDDAYIELGIRYPSFIPEGYEVSFVSDPVYGSQSIHYLGEEEHFIYYSYTTADGGFSADLAGVRKDETVYIGDTAGILYTLKGGQRVLFWTDDADGIGCMISTDDGKADILGMAESVCVQKEALRPTFDGAAGEAIAELGDHGLTLLPDGFVSAGTAGMPESTGGGWYAYVIRNYVNKSTNTKLVLTYERYKLDGTENTEENVLSLAGNGERVSLNGRAALAVRSIFGNSVCWADTGNCIKYTLYSDKMYMEDLIRLAELVD